jgi:hypothetical protein
MRASAQLAPPLDAGSIVAGTLGTLILRRG